MKSWGNFLEKTSEGWSATPSQMKEKSRNFKEKEINFKRYFLTFGIIPHYSLTFHN